MYVLQWSSYCCDRGHMYGVTEIDGFVEALGRLWDANDPRGSDGPCGATLFRVAKGGALVRVGPEPFEESVTVRARLREHADDLKAALDGGASFERIERLTSELNHYVETIGMIRRAMEGRFERLCELASGMDAPYEDWHERMLKGRPRQSMRPREEPRFTGLYC